MFKRLVCEAHIDLHITTAGPLLIKSGRRVTEEPDMQALRTYAAGDWHPVIPGSSLKGALRAHAEQTLRSLTPENAPACCNPFTRERASPDLACSERLEPRRRLTAAARRALADDERGEGQRVPAPEAYRASCAACRLFGSTHLAGRLAVDDALVVNREAGYQEDGVRGRYHVEVRDGVGIDRWTGGAATGIKFTLEAVTNAVFDTRLSLENFELWQLGLVGLTLMDLVDGWLRLGSTKTRGFGAVRGQVTGVRLSYLPVVGLASAPGDQIEGTGRRLPEAMRADYGFLAGEAEAAALPAGLTPAPRGLRTVLDFATAAQRAALWDAGRRALLAAAPGFYDRRARVAEGAG